MQSIDAKIAPPVRQSEHPFLEIVVQILESIPSLPMFGAGVPALSRVAVPENTPEM
jgi:hypothetical protein